MFDIFADAILCKLIKIIKSQQYDYSYLANYRHSFMPPTAIIYLPRLLIDTGILPTMLRKITNERGNTSIEHGVYVYTFSNVCK